MANSPQETRTVTETVLELEGKKIHLIEVPGLRSVPLIELHTLVQVTSWVNIVSKAVVRLNGLIYMHGIFDTLMSDIIVKYLGVCSRLLGDEGLSKVVLVTTISDEIDQETGHARQLGLSSRYWKPLIEQGSSIYRFDYTTASALRIISSLSSGKPEIKEQERKPEQFREVSIEEIQPAPGISDLEMLSN